MGTKFLSLSLFLIVPPLFKTIHTIHTNCNSGLLFFYSIFQFFRHFGTQLITKSQKKKSSLHPCIPVSRPSLAPNGTKLHVHVGWQKIIQHYRNRCQQSIKIECVFLASHLKYNAGTCMCLAPAGEDKQACELRANKNQMNMFY